MFGCSARTVFINVGSSGFLTEFKTSRTAL
jgi:hypothetical protein